MIILIKLAAISKKSAQTINIHSVMNMRDIGGRCTTRILYYKLTYILAYVITSKRTFFHTD